MATSNSKIDHLNAILFREAKIVLSNYEKYLLDKITSKQLAENMLSLKHVIEKLEQENKNLTKPI